MYNRLLLELDVDDVVTGDSGISLAAKLLIYIFPSDFFPVIITPSGRIP